MWMLAAAVAVFAAHVSLGWVREIQRQPSLRQSWKGLLLASATMGAGITSGVVLALSAEALPFPLGYQLSRVLMLWALSLVACLPACYWLMRKQGLLATLGSGVLLAPVAAGLQVGWIMAVGFRPGVTWRPEFVIGASVFLLLGITAAVSISYSTPSRKGRRRQLWRLGGATMLGLSLVAGQEILISGAGLLAQVGSVYKDHVPAALVCLVAGVIVPLLLSVLAVDLELRRRQRRRRRSKDPSSTLAPLSRDRQQTPTASS